MDFYKDLYFQMVHASEQALRALDRQDFGTARSILISAQQEAAEARYLEQEEAEASGLFEAQALPPAGNPPPFSFVLTKENGRGRSRENRFGRKDGPRAVLS